MRRLFSIPTLLFLLLSCTSSNSDPIEDTSSEWLVQEMEVTGTFSLYPLVQDPEFEAVTNVDLADGELVAMINLGHEVRIYPYAHTNAFEVINDDFIGNKIAVTYCPITKSGVCFSRNINGSINNFRASGYLYKDNLMPYDEATESIWSQMRLQAVFGQLSGHKFNTVNLVETNWGTVKEYFTNAKVFIGSGKITLGTNKDPDEVEDNVSEGEAPSDGDFVYGVLENGATGSVNIFEYNQFIGTKLFHLPRSNKDIIVVGDANKRIISSYFIENHEEFEAVTGQFPVVMTNMRNGSRYNIFGVAVSGPDNGRRLQSPDSFVAIWWAWKGIYSNFKFNNNL